MDAEVCLLSLLYEKVWNLEEIRKVLQKTPSSVNERMFLPPFKCGSKFKLSTPLHYVLRRENCSADVVKLLLEYGADPNAKDKGTVTPLYVSLSTSRDVEVVRALIEHGAIVDPDHDLHLCTALGYGSSKDVIELLVKAGCLLHGCRKLKHLGSLLHCVTDIHVKEGPVNLDVLKMLLVEKDADPLAVNFICQNAICFALQRDNSAYCIQLLLEATGSLGRCTTHSSYLLCATDQMKTPLRASVVELLLKSGVSASQVNRDRMNPLQCALLKKRLTDTKAIRLLLDCHKGVDLNTFADEESNSLLHLAVKNNYCISSVVKLLIRQGVKVNNLNMHGRTPLHEAVINVKCKLNVLEVLVRNGAEVNTYDVRLALEKLRCIGIVKLLLAACASVSYFSIHSMIKLVAGQVTEYKCRLVCLKFLVKFHILKYSNFLLHVLDFDHKHYGNISRFRRSCVQELEEMRTTKISRRHTLYRFLCPIRGEIRRYDFDRLLHVIEAFPMNFEFIAEKVSRPQIEAKLPNLQMYAWEFPSSNCRVRKKVFLNYDCILKISQHLNNKNLLSLVLAFLTVDGRLPDAKDSKGKKRKAKEPQLSYENRCLSRKRPKTAEIEFYV